MAQSHGDSDDNEQGQLVRVLELSEVAGVK